MLASKVNKRDSKSVSTHPQEFRGISWDSNVRGLGCKSVVVNLRDRPVQAKGQVRWPDAGGGKWNLVDSSSAANHERDGDEMLFAGPPLGTRPLELALFPVPTHEETLDHGRRGHKFYSVKASSRNRKKGDPDETI